MIVGNTVRWTAKDDQGTYSYKGVVKEVTDTHVKLETDEGIFSVEKNDGTFKVLKRTAYVPPVDVLAKIVTKTSSKKPAGTKTKRVGKTTRVQALEIYKRMSVNAEPARKDVIAAFVKDLGMTPAGASTYHYNCKKVTK